MRTWWSEQPKALLAGLFAVNLLFVTIHVVADERRGSWTSLYTDTGPAGIWGAGQALVAAWLVYRVFQNTRVNVYLVWAFTFAVVALDDFLELHESVGQWLDTAVGLPSVFGLRGADLGELIIWGVMGAPILVALAYAFREADHAARRDSAIFFVLMVVLVIVAAGLDALHMAVVTDYEAVSTLGTLEDGGELFVLSLLLTSAVAVHRSSTRLDQTVGADTPRVG